MMFLVTSAYSTRKHKRLLVEGIVFSVLLVHSVNLMRLLLGYSFFFFSFFFFFFFFVPIAIPTVLLILVLLSSAEFD